MKIQKFEKLENDEQHHKFKIKTEVSEIDKYIKCLVITDAFKILMKSIDLPVQQIKEDDDFKYYSYERLYPPG